MAEKKAEETRQVSVRSFKQEVVRLKLVGASPLISNRFREEQIDKIRDKQAKKGTGGREAKDPEREFRGSLYINPDSGNYAVPALAFKQSAVSACRQDDSFTMVKTEGAFHVMGEFVDLEDGNGQYWCEGVKEPRMREDITFVGRSRAADLRYRGEYWPWAVTLPIRYNPAAISLEEIAYLFDLAGFAVGVGDWRPEKSGNHGMFELER